MEEGASKDRKKGLGLLSLWMGWYCRGRRALIDMYSYLIIECRGGRARLFPEVHRGRTRDNKHKLEHRKL